MRTKSGGTERNGFVVVVEVYAGLFGEGGIGKGQVRPIDASCDSGEVEKGVESRL